MYLFEITMGHWRLIVGKILISCLSQYFLLFQWDSISYMKRRVVSWCFPGPVCLPLWMGLNHPVGLITSFQAKSKRFFVSFTFHILPAQLINESFIHWHLTGRILFYIFHLSHLKSRGFFLLSFNCFPSMANLCSLASSWIIHSSMTKHVSLVSESSIGHSIWIFDN